MIRCAYILSFDRDDDFDYKKFHQQLIKLPIILNWSHYIKSSYILIAETNYAGNLNKALSPLKVLKEEAAAAAAAKKEAEE